MPIPQRVVLVVNPVSGSQDKTELIDKVRKQAAARGFALEVYQTDGENDQREIEKLLTDFEPDRMLIAGGDGTITQMADLMREHTIVTGFLPVGSANGLATNLGLPTDLGEAIDVALGEHTRCLDGMLINGRLGLHLSDLGLNARLVKNYGEHESHGKWGYAKEVVRTLAEHERFRVRITTDTDTFETEATMVILANATMYGTGVVVNPHGDMCDGKFEVVVATRFDILELAKLIAGKTELDPEVVKIVSTTQAEIECLDKKMLFQIDGEFIDKVSRVKARILPGMLTVASPPVSQEAV